jgi:hypothetical protein
MDERFKYPASSADTQRNPGSTSASVNLERGRVTCRL